MSDFAAIIQNAPKGILDAPLYRAGKPISELQRELNLPPNFEIVKLASNENPLGPSSKAIAAQAGDAGSLHIYPDASGFELRQKIAKTVNAKFDQVLLGNGSEELLAMITRAFLREGDEVVVSEHCFPQYRIQSKIVGATLRQAPVSPVDLSQSAESIKQTITPHTRMVMVATPDNPTGAILRPHELEEIREAMPRASVLVVDEAYHGLCVHPEYRSSLEGPNRVNDGERPIITCRTFSKSAGLAGIRAAYAVLPEELCAHLMKVKLPFNVNATAQRMALAALDDVDHVTKTRELIESERPYVIGECRRLGLKVIEGSANFVLVNTGEREAEPVTQELLKKGVIVRPLGEALKHYMRVSIGTHAQNERFVQALESVIR